MSEENQTAQENEHETLETLETQEAPQEENFKDKYLRLLAEVENMRKRMSKEKQDSIKYSLDRIVSDFLNPLDNLENALKYTKSDTVSSDVKNWAMGFEMIVNQFKEALSVHGVESFEALGKAFDPNLHQALEMVETDGPENMVIEECLKGYKREDRIIRVARVKVSKKTNPNLET